MAITLDNNNLTSVRFNSDPVYLVDYNGNNVFTDIPAFTKSCKYAQYGVFHYDYIYVDDVLINQGNGEAKTSGYFYIDVNGDISLTGATTKRLVEYTIDSRSHTLIRTYVQNGQTHNVYNNSITITIGSYTKTISYEMDVNTSSLGTNSDYIPDTTWSQTI